MQKQETGQLRQASTRDVVDAARGPIPTDPATNPIEQPITYSLMGRPYNDVLTRWYNGRACCPIDRSVVQRAAGIITPAKAEARNLLVTHFIQTTPRYAENVVIIYICFPTSEASELPAIWSRGSSCEGNPWQAPNVHPQAGLLPNQVAHCPMGQAH
jgi:hypothetical protein